MTAQTDIVTIGLLKTKFHRPIFQFKKTSCFCVSRIMSILIQADILFPFSFQFFSRLAAVFAEEVGDLPLHGFDFGVRPRFYFGII